MVFAAAELVWIGDMRDSRDRSPELARLDDVVDHKPGHMGCWIAAGKMELVYG